MACVQSTGGISRLRRSKSPSRETPDSSPGGIDCHATLKKHAGYRTTTMPTAVKKTHVFQAEAETARNLMRSRM